MRNNFKYTSNQKQFIIDNHKGTGHKAMSDLFYKEFGIRIDRVNIKNFYGNNKLNSGLTGRFEKGETPFNKGLKQVDYMTQEGIEKSSKTRFKKGEDPHNRREINEERTDKDGYLYVKIQDGKKNLNWKLKSHIIWEEAYGKIPKSCRIIYLDGDKTNLELNNLALVSNAVGAIMNRFNLFKNNPELTKTGIMIAKVIKESNRTNYGNLVKSIRKTSYGFLINDVYEVHSNEDLVKGPDEIPNYIYKMKNKLLSIQETINEP